MMGDLLIIVNIFSFSLGLTACCIVLFSNKTHLHANRLLAVTLFCLAAMMLSTFILQWNPALYVYVYRFPSPLSYLLVAAAFLYLRAVLKNEHRFKRWDWLHFVPALLHLLEMLPFYFSGFTVRNEHAMQAIAD